MDSKKTGGFIAALRNERGLTQKELADKIGVTDKAVSKWECGRGFPDIGILEILAKQLDVSITELMNGERFTPERQSEQSDSAILSTVMYIKAMTRRTLGILMIIFGAFLTLSPIYGGGLWVTVALIVGILMIVGGVILIAVKKPQKHFGLSKFAAEAISLCALGTAIILEALPYGAVLKFAPGPNISKLAYYSYFSLVPFGYANFAPFITAFLTVMLTVWTLVVFFVSRKVKGARNALFIAITVTAVISVCPAVFGIDYITGIGVGITVLLAAATVFRAAANAKSY